MEWSPADDDDVDAAAAAVAMAVAPEQQKRNGIEEKRRQLAYANT